jgi:hypothetical protein
MFYEDCKKLKVTNELLANDATSSRCKSTFDENVSDGFMKTLGLAEKNFFSSVIGGLV